MAKHKFIPRPIPTIAIMPDHQLSVTELVEKWCVQLCEVLTRDYEKRYDNYRCRFHLSSGRKYWKILETEGSVHAFVDKKTGEVYKPASWSSPAKGVRYDLRIIKEREACLNNADWAGGYLYCK